MIFKIQNLKQLSLWNDSNKNTNKTLFNLNKSKNTKKWKDQKTVIATKPNVMHPTKSQKFWLLISYLQEPELRESSENNEKDFNCVRDYEIFLIRNPQC